MARSRCIAAAWMVCGTIGWAGLPATADAAEIVISINKAAQTMSVLVDGVEQHSWIVSTGIGGGPPNGTYRAGRMERKWASRKYHMAPMPYSIFFEGNYAIHGTVQVKQLGRRASKGCVRLHPRDAAVLFGLVGRNKVSTTIVVATASHVAARPPEPPPVALPSPAPVATPIRANADAVTVAPAPPPPRLVVPQEPAAEPARLNPEAVTVAPARPSTEAEPRTKAIEE